jgi:glycosyltransferase involved in cell wall biosynthesis
MKVLFVMPQYLPYGAPVSHIVSELAENNIDIEFDVLTSKYEIDDLATEKIGKVNVYRADNYNNYSLKSIVKQKDRMLKKLTMVLQKIKRRIVKKCANSRVRDTSVINSYIRTAKSLTENEYDVIIPFVAATEMFDVGEYIVKFYNQNAKLVLFQIDPIAGNIGYDPHSSTRWSKYEKKCYEKCDAIIMLPTILKDNDCINDYLYKTHVLELPFIRNLYQEQESISIQTDEIVLAYCGYLHSRIRNPKYFFELLSNINFSSMRIIICGTGCQDIINNYKDNVFGDRMKILGLVKSEESLKVLSDADILINIGNIRNNQMPSKIFEYISMGKPIINICTKSNCPTLRYMKRYPLSINIIQEESDIQTQARQLESFIHEKAKRRLSFEKIKELYIDCTSDVVAKKFSEIIKGVIKNNDR